MPGPARRLILSIANYIVYLYNLLWVPFVTVAVETGTFWAEEAILTVVREATAVFYRVLNGVSGMFVSLFIDRAHWKRHRSAWSDGDVSESRLTEDGVVSTFNAIVEREASHSSFVSPVEGLSRKPHYTRSLRATETVPSQSSSSHGRKEILPFWGNRKRVRGNHGGGAVDDGHSPRHTAQLFLAKNYNLSQSAVSYDRGVLEETMINLEVFVTRMFDNLRGMLRSILLVPTRSFQQPEAPRPYTRRNSFQDLSELGGMRPSRERRRPSREEKVGLQRTRSAGTMDAVPRKQVASRDGDISVTDLIRSSGYPAEEHEVTTTDGYRLRMDRIPRGGKRVVFFVHGILDTSLSWVCTGATESQAFAAWDAGCDVWLANSRSNPPRQHVDPAFQGPAYWHYSVNELGLHDLHAQIEHIHNVKCRELGAGIVTIPRSVHIPTAHKRPSEEGSVAQVAKNGAAASTGATAVLSRKRLVPPPSETTTANPLTAAVKHTQQAVGRTEPPIGTPAGPSASSMVAQAAIAMTSSLFRASSGGLDRGERRMPTSSRVSCSGASTSSEALVGDVLRGRQPCRTIPAPDAASAPASINARVAGHNDNDPQPSQDKLPSLPLSEVATTSSPLLLSPETELEGACRAFEEDVEEQAKNKVPPSLPTAFNLDSPLAARRSTSHEEPNPTPDKASMVFSWLPAGVAMAEQEALELGVQRTGPYFLSSTMPAIDDVVEIDMAGGSRGVGRTLSQSAPASRAVLPAAEDWRDAPTATPKARLSLPVVPSSPGTPPLPGTFKSEGISRRVSRNQQHMGQGDAVASEAAAMNGNVRVSAESAGQSSHVPTSASAAAPQQGDANAAAANKPSRRSSIGSEAQEPYTLTGVGHSLGGAALLMYIVQFRRSNRRHRLSRLVLLTPAGFIERLPAIVRPVAFMLPTILQLTTRLFPGVLSLPVFVPTSVLRSLMFRLTADMKHIPALTNLIRSWTAFFMNGDSSGWDQALRMAHYNKTSMPAVSLLQAKHMLQWVNTGRFSMFDYGSRDLNLAAYGQPQPVDIAAEYWRINVPVDFAAGKHDGIITPACVKKHWRQMIASSVSRVTYREFDFGHLDFTFSAKQDLRHHVISCIEQGP